MFTIIDIETTGGNSKSDKITEIAIYQHDGTKIINEYSTLINPERRIPFYITELTGIDDDMVADAPKFFEVAKDIVDLTSDAVFVAHNVGFDYNFIRSEFKSLGYDFNRPKLCTVKLSRLLMPGKTSYSLGRLCKDLNINISHRHRASGDALATVTLFEMLLAKDQHNIIAAGGKPKHLPAHLNSNLSPDIIDALPDKAGVYYFFNGHHELIYVGKSKNIKSRIRAHLNNFDNLKAIELRNEMAFIEYELTGSELISMLLESVEIKRHKPYFNRAQLKSGYNYGVFMELLIDGFIHFKAGKISGKNHPIAVFTSQNQAKGFLNHTVEEFDLCPKLAGLDYTNGPCIRHLTQHCDGHCREKDRQEDYNSRAMTVVKSMEYDHANFLIIDRGRHENEISVVQIEKGRYCGYGYAEEAAATDNIETLKNCIDKQEDNREVQQIIKGFLKKNTAEKVIPY
ncbi:exonuclease domain-containing protein [Fulvivirgaceae bacterium BMA12]|uniref:Exonuclease domain-containing protein n=1 Tax=Agaribacillus aureus TaxID=3051825 RepID=A0ABT8LHW3_9BACT|nr:exonuclease domain-containing protein [Fulvivirgaceae bacterium BMA12]